MKTVKIQWLWDDHDCETCGSSYSEGALVTIKEKGKVDLTLDFSPMAHCFDSVEYSTDFVYASILNTLGYELVEERDHQR
jgi:hypothetical protein